MLKECLKQPLFRRKAMGEFKFEQDGSEKKREKPCPECGEPMEERERMEEDSAIFIWYQCAQKGCCGQWLTKKRLNGSKEM
jgi:hypothetical protein